MFIDLFLAVIALLCSALAALALLIFMQATLALWDRGWRARAIGLTASIALALFLCIGIASALTLAYSAFNH